MLDGSWRTSEFERDDLLAHALTSVLQNGFVFDLEPLSGQTGAHIRGLVSSDGRKGSLYSAAMRAASRVQPFPSRRTCSDATVAFVRVAPPARDPLARPDFDHMGRTLPEG